MKKIETKRELGLFYGVIMALSGAFGIEFFVLLQYTTLLAGPAVVLALFLCGVITTLTMFSYCELGAAISRVGGEYTFAKVAFGGFLSFLTGWMRWISSVFVTALAAIGFAQFLSYFFPTIQSSPYFTPLVSAGVILTFTFLSLRGVKESDVIMVVTFIAISILLILMGIPALDLRHFQPFMPKGPFGVLAGVMYAFSMFVGLRAVVAGGPQMKKPEKNIPRSILLSVAILMAVYCGIAFIVVGIVPLDLEISKPFLTYAAEKIVGPIGGLLLTIAAIFVALMSLTTSLMVQKSILSGLSRDGYLPSFILSSHPRLGERYPAVILGSVLAILFAVTGLVVFIGYVSGFASLLVFALVNLSLIKLRKKKPRLNRPFKAPLYPFTPLIGLGVSIVLMLFVEPAAFLLGFEFIILAIMIYHLKMVGYYRLCLAVGGINLGIGGSILLFLYLLKERMLSLPLEFDVKLLYSTIIISSIFILAGILNLTTRIKKEPKVSEFLLTG